MYIPSAFRIDDLPALYDFIDQYSFATLVTVSQDEPFATHLPVLLDRERGLLRGHVARANPQWRDFDEHREALVIFQGPHAYVSPAWYSVSPAVPTWNYTAVHVYGAPRLLERAATLQLLDDLVRNYESARERPWRGDLPTDYRAKLVEAIVGFEVKINRIEGKFKLSQNRSEEDRSGVVTALAASSHEDDRGIAEWMKQINRIGESS